MCFNFKYNNKLFCVHFYVTLYIAAGVNQDSLVKEMFLVK